jgi:hypothetical protein
MWEDFNLFMFLFKTGEMIFVALISLFLFPVGWAWTILAGGTIYFKGHFENPVTFFISFWIVSVIMVCIFRRKLVCLI